MQLWVVLGIGAVLLVALALLAALRLRIDARGFGEPDGSWAVAFGVDAGLATLAGVLRAGASPRFELIAFGRRFPLRRTARSSPAAKAKPRRASDARRRERLWARSSLAEKFEFLRSKSRSFAVESLEVDVGYGFRDIVLTGKIAGALYAVSGVLPARMRLTHRPRWDGAERFEVAVQGRVSVWVGRVLAELVWFMLRGRLRSESVLEVQPANSEHAKVSR